MFRCGLVRIEQIFDNITHVESLVDKDSNWCNHAEDGRLKAAKHGDRI